MSPEPLNAIVLDLGDVLFSWSAKTKTGISSKTMHHMLSTTTWFDYECGRISAEECYERVGLEFSVDPAVIADAFEQARESLQPNDELLSVIRGLKAQSGGTLRVYAMSNISLPDYEFLRAKELIDGAVFDRVFASAAAGERKPNLAFYTHVVAETGLDPRKAVFVDDKIENVLSARSLGFHGIVFDDAASVMRQLRNLCGDPAKRAWDFLRSNAGRLHSVTNNGLDIQENFAELLILEATGDPSLVSIAHPERTWNFFRGKGVLTKEDFPDDLDTTSLGLTITKPDPAVVHSVLDEMLEYLNPDGIVQTYFDHSRPRFDACVCVNVLGLFYTHGRGAQLSRTLEWVHQVLVNRAYLDGTRYYTTAECFLFFIGRLLDSCNDEEIHRKLKPVFRERVIERIGAEGDALALAMRIVACASVGVPNEVDMRTLLSMQCDDGGWETGWVYKLVLAKTLIGSRGLATAIALKAISCAVPPPLPSTSTSHAARDVESQLGTNVPPTAIMATPAIVQVY